MPGVNDPDANLLRCHQDGGDVPPYQCKDVLHTMTLQHISNDASSMFAACRVNLTNNNKISQTIYYDS